MIWTPFPLILISDRLSITITKEASPTEDIGDIGE